MDHDERLNRTGTVTPAREAPELRHPQAIDRAATATLTAIAVLALLGGSLITMMAQMGIAGCSPNCNYSMAAFAGYLTPVVGVTALIAMSVALRRQPSRHHRWRIPAVAFVLIVVSTAISLSLTALAL